MRFAASPLTTNGDAGAICATAVAVKINATQSKLTLLWTLGPTLRWIRFIVPPLETFRFRLWSDSRERHRIRRIALRSFRIVDDAYSGTEWRRFAHIPATALDAV